jgi:hypothetical protein
MILGVYWYFKFPENLYHFKFLNFSKDMADMQIMKLNWLQEFRLGNTENFIAKLEELKSRFKEAFFVS